jgi:hypothetical protein
MNKLTKFLLWSVVFLALLLACDQLLLRVPMRQPALATIRSFYLDFRGRLLHLGEHRPPPTIDQLIDREVQSPPPLPAAKRLAPAAKTAAPASGPRFLYVDGEGNLQFADRLEDIPRKYRKAARPMER